MPEIERGNQTAVPFRAGHNCRIGKAEWKIPVSPNQLDGAIDILFSTIEQEISVGYADQKLVEYLLTEIPFDHVRKLGEQCHR